ncbi:hypothetical protein ABTX77_26620 [Streptomyces sp. NPDC097704]|uniref:hypothetical protein n=1 Tax=Streptomyces sp. NPDC097704 TaxID=3157101 RepID=UPI0033308272
MLDRKKPQDTMAFIAHVQTADEASELIADLAGGNVRDLDVLAHHLGPVRLTLDPEHEEVRWAPVSGCP